MPDPTPTPAPPTQVARPWRTTLRTVVQNLLGIVIAAGLVLPLILAIVQEELGDIIPDRAMGWLVGAVAITVAISAAVTRIMAIPAVETFLRRHGFTRGLAADPNPTPAPPGPVVVDDADDPFGRNEAGESVLRLVVLVVLVVAVVWLFLALL